MATVSPSPVVNTGAIQRDVGLILVHLLRATTIPRSVQRYSIMPDETLDSGQWPSGQRVEVTDGDLLAAYSCSAAICILDRDQRFLWVLHDFAAMSRVLPSEPFGKKHP